MWDFNLGVQACQKISSHFDLGGVYMLHRGTYALSLNHDYTRRLSKFLWFIRIPMSYWPQTFLGLHVPRAKETPCLGFFGDGLLLSEV